MMQERYDTKLAAAYVRSMAKRMNMPLEDSILEKPLDMLTREEQELYNQAAEIISAARTKSYELEQEIAALESRYELMKTRVKLLLYAEIELLDKNEILAEKEANAETTK